jgi:MFS family permease
VKRLIAATALSQVGTEVTAVALPLTAIVTLGASTFQAGLLYSAEYLPLALVGLVAGAWADRVRRRRLMVATDLLRGGLIALVPIAFVSGRLGLPLLYAVALAVGGLTVFFQAAESAIVPVLVERAQLTTTNSRLQLAEQAAGIVGPGVGGFLAGAIGAPLALVVDAASYVGSGALISAIRLDDHPATGAGERLPAAVRAGLAVLWNDRRLRALTLTAALNGFFGRMIMAVLVVYLVRSAHLTAYWVGVALSIASIGFASGAAIAPWVAARIGQVGAIRLGSAIASASYLLIAIPPANVAGPFVSAGLFVYGIGALLFTVNATTLRQTVTPAGMLGRVSSAARALSWGAIPVAGAAGGALAGVLGIRTLLLVAAAGALTACLPALLTPLSDAPMDAAPMKAL